jgi:hypothetical protein
MNETRGDETMKTKGKDKSAARATRPKLEIVRSYPDMLLLARAQIADQQMAERVARHCVDYGCCLRHGIWELNGREGLCFCSPCVKARGEKPVCL